MVRLAREIRFSVNPFLEADPSGANAYTSKPSGQGLALFFELTVEIAGPVDPDTGFVVNVVDIDQATRRYAVPTFAERIRTHYRAGKHIDLDVLAQTLAKAGTILAGKFGAAQVDRLILKLNPYRKITMETNEPGVLYFSEKFEFAAMHKLWNDEFSAERNFEVFGKCAHPTGHGHNYVVEVTVQTAPEAADFEVGRFQQIVDTELIALVDHKNLNVDLGVFRKTIPTVENLAAFAWNQLVEKLQPVRLHSVTIWESDRTYCTYQG
ncbi:MAG: 6-carboxytetrahydropterin synthase [Phycisphaerales bacterium]|nr:MAG: 6-carboxytetrahydropterin synthase [Phycisphaerales bacterium]